MYDQFVQGETKMTLKKVTKQELIHSFSTIANRPEFAEVKDLANDLVFHLEHEDNLLIINEMIFKEAHETKDIHIAHLLSLLQWELSFRLIVNWPYEIEHEENKEGK